MVECLTSDFRGNLKAVSMLAISGLPRFVALDVRIQDRSGEGVSPSNGISNVNGHNSGFVAVVEIRGGNMVLSSCSNKISHPIVTNHTPDAIDRILSSHVVVLDPGIQTFDQVGNFFGSVNTIDTSRIMYAITKIINPIEYSISKLNDPRDILVTFLVLRHEEKGSPETKKSSMKTSILDHVVENGHHAPLERAQSIT
ncbi:hypothetical protein Tco_1554081 [Tanacetum coccineum]